MLLLLLLLQAPIPLIEENPVPPDQVIQLIPQPGKPLDTSPSLNISIVAGGVSSLGSTDSYSVHPTGKIEVDAKISEHSYAPRLFVRAMLSSLAGDSIDLTNVSSFTTLEFEGGLEQPIPGIYPRLYAGFGVATRLPGDTEPRVNAAKYFTAGVVFVTDSRDSYLYVGGGPDQRLNVSGLYELSAHIEGQVKLYSFKDAKFSLFGDAILGPASSQVRVGVVVGI